MKSKRISLLFISFIFVTFVYSNAAELTVMSFNLQGFSPTAPSGNHRPNDNKWVEKIARTIDQADADIILLQEAWIGRGNDESFFNLLISNLGKYKKGNWAFITCYSYCNKSNSTTNNAIIYNKSVVSLVKDIGATELFNGPNVKYKFQHNNIQVVQFKFYNKNFIVINAHLPNPSRTLDLKKERDALSALYANLKHKNPIIIGGDFNTNRKTLLDGSNFSDAIIDGNSGFFADKQGQGTTLNRNKHNIGIANDYDHFIVKNLYISEQMHPVYFDKNIAASKKNPHPYKETIKLGKSKYKSSFYFVKYVSDHLPIMIKLDFHL